jgi:hypothetical protein
MTEIIERLRASVGELHDLAVLIAVIATGLYLAILFLVMGAIR